MEKNDFENYLNNRYRKQVSWYDSHAGFHKRTYHVFQWGLIFLSALTPLLVAVDVPDDLWLKYMPHLSAFLVAFLASGLKAFKFQEKWSSYRATCETLIREEHYYYAHLFDYEDSLDPESLFIQRVEAIISRENTDYVGIVVPDRKDVKSH